MSIRRIESRLFRRLAVLLAMAANVDRAAAETVRWVAPDGGSYSAAGNWNPAGVPGAADVALFDLSDAYVVTFPAQRPRPGEPTNRAVHIYDDEVTFDLNSRTLTLTDSGDSPSLLIGYGGRFDRGNQGALTLLDGTVLGVDGVLGRAGGLPISRGNLGELIIGSGAMLDLSGGLYVGDDARGALHIEQGGHAEAKLWVGFEEGASGNVLIENPGSLLTTAQPTIANLGTASMTIADGGRVDSNGAGYVGRFAGSDGVVEIVGPGSSWHATGAGMAVGDDGVGRIEVREGATFLSGGTTTLGKSSRGVGEVRISGVGATWQHTSVVVGGQGAGKLTIADGAMVSTLNSGVLGANSSGVGDAFIQGMGSHWAIDVDLAIGDSGRGALSILDGGSLSARQVLLGARLNAPGIGEMVVQGVSSRSEIAEQLVVGGGGGAGVRAGRLAISGGGVVESHLGMIAATTGAMGRVEVDGPGSTWRNRDSLHIGGSDLGPGGQGTLVVEDEGLVEATNSITIWDTGHLQLDGGRIEAPSVAIRTGMLSGEGTITGDVFNAGRLEVGDAIGRLVVTGDYAENFAGRIVMEIAGASVGEYDVLQIDGQVLFNGGNLDVMFVDGYLPQAGDVYDLLDFDTAGGELGGVQLPALAEGLRWRTGDFMAAGQFAVIVDILGDTNADGRVDLEDLNNVRNNFGLMSMPILGDTDDDNDVDLNDLNNVRNNFGASSSPLQSVPEPSSGMLVGLGASCMLIAGRRSRPRLEVALCAIKSLSETPLFRRKGSQTARDGARLAQSATCGQIAFVRSAKQAPEHRQVS